ncbi:hypothetical protein GT755_01945 [Herbidospora sp. NEAU-GS84]|uniref:Uncharacterized protein n=1 Tax=Herbidospora solisilvae TaxID=2696284 RepID=A0A7C9JBF1_9ACTN|nr:hypothetical protein [Herbidospora solisilvae]NAS20443.1 hypothetical protein [Herbidospora solisilvae]
MAADESPWAEFNLALVLAKMDDLREIAAYRRVIDSGHAEDGPKAAYNLG